MPVFDRVNGEDGTDLISRAAQRCYGQLLEETETIVNEIDNHTAQRLLKKSIITFGKND